MIPPNLLSLKTTLILAGLLVLSLAGNAVLLKRVWSAQARCTASVAVEANATIAKAEEAEDARDLVSAEITRDTDEKAAAAAQSVQSTTQADQEAVSDAYRDHRPASPPRGADPVVCRPEPVAGVRERFDAARDRANAAAR